MTIRNGSESLMSRLLSLLLLLLLLLGLSAAPAASQAIDLDAARSMFAEAEAVAGAGSELWGVELYGPMLFVDRGTRTVVANVADAEGNLAERDGVFTGTLPVDVGIANTGVDWAGRRWTMLVWPLPAGVWQRRVLLVHEMYHRVQPELGMSFPDGSNAHLDTAEGRTWLRLEWRALREALGAPGDARRTAARDALAFRARRRSAFPEGVEDERRLELNEGLAEYTGVRVAIATDARHGWAARQLDEHDGLARSRSVVRSFAYASGPAYGLLLDATDSDWRAEVTDSTDLGSLLEGRIGVAEGGVRASVYGGERVAAEEAERERVRVAQQESFRQRFEVGPTLTLPVGEGFGYSFDPNAVTPFGDVGSVYATAAVRGPWGRLQVTSGGVLMLQGADGIQGVVVPAPSDAAGSPLSGDGWTLELNDGWELEAGEREGDLIVRPSGGEGRELEEAAAAPSPGWYVTSDGDPVLVSPAPGEGYRRLDFANASFGALETEERWMPWPAAPYDVTEASFVAWDGAVLEGVLLEPRNPSGRGAVIVHGSGSSDRDNVWAYTFAHALAEGGVAVLFADKRGSGASAGDWRNVGFDALARDAVSAAGELAARASLPLDSIGWVGLSQGGWVAPLAARIAGRGAFVVSVSSAAVPVFDQIEFEVENTLRNEGFPDEAVAAALELHATLQRHALGEVPWTVYEEARSRASAGPAAPFAAAMPAEADDWRWAWWARVGDYDPAGSWLRAALPTLVLYGAEDELDNVPVGASVARLRELARRPGVAGQMALEVFPSLGHTLVDPETGWVSRSVLDRLVAFVRSAGRD